MKIYVSKFSPIFKIEIFLELQNVQLLSAFAIYIFNEKYKEFEG